MPPGTQGPPLPIVTVVTHAAGVLDGDMDGEVVLMSAANGEYYALDAVASTLWRLTATPLTVGALCRGMCERYEGSAETVTADVLAFVRDLIQRGLLRIEA